MRLKTIPARYADIFFNDDYGKIPYETFITDRRDRFLPGVSWAHIRYPQYTGSLGASVASWCEDSEGINTPEGVFAILFLERCADRKAIKAALAEFSKLKECGWARRMYNCMRYDDLE